MNKFLTLIFLCISFCFIIPSSYAASDTTYIIRITAKQPYNTIPFNATYMAISDNGSSLEKIEQTTPYEYALQASFIGIMLEIDTSRPDIKIEITEKTNHGEKIKASGFGHSIFAHDSVDGNTYILAR